MVIINSDYSIAHFLIGQSTNLGARNLRRKCTASSAHGFTLGMSLSNGCLSVHRSWRGTFLECCCGVDGNAKKSYEDAADSHDRVRCYAWYCSVCTPEQEPGACLLSRAPLAALSHYTLCKSHHSPTISFSLSPPPRTEIDLATDSPYMKRNFVRLSPRFVRALHAHRSLTALSLPSFSFLARTPVLLPPFVLSLPSFSFIRRGAATSTARSSFSSFGSAWR